MLRLYAIGSVRSTLGSGWGSDPQSQRACVRNTGHCSAMVSINRKPSHPDGSAAMEPPGTRSNSEGTGNAMVDGRRNPDTMLPVLRKPRPTRGLQRRLFLRKDGRVVAEAPAVIEDMQPTRSAWSPPPPRPSQPETGAREVHPPPGPVPGRGTVHSPDLRSADSRRSWPGPGPANRADDGEGGRVQSRVFPSWMAASPQHFAFNPLEERRTSSDAPVENPALRASVPLRR